MPYAHPEDHDRRPYFRAYFIANKEKIYKRADEWRKKNRERSNAHSYLRLLRKLKDPKPHHIRKMAELCRKYPKRRIVLWD